MFFDDLRKQKQEQAKAYAPSLLLRTIGSTSDSGPRREIRAAVYVHVLHPAPIVWKPADEAFHDATNQAFSTMWIDWRDERIAELEAQLREPEPNLCFCLPGWRRR